MSKNLPLFIFDLIFLPIHFIRGILIYINGSRYGIKGLKFLDVIMHADKPYFNQNYDYINTINENFQEVLFNDIHNNKIVKNNEINETSNVITFINNNKIVKISDESDNNLTNDNDKMNSIFLDNDKINSIFLDNDKTSNNNNLLDNDNNNLLDNDKTINILTNNDKTNNDTTNNNLTNNDKTNNNLTNNNKTNNNLTNDKTNNNNLTNDKTNNNLTNDNSTFSFRKKTTSKINIFDIIKNELENVINDDSDYDS